MKRPLRDFTGGAQHGDPGGLLPSRDYWLARCEAAFASGELPLRVQASEIKSRLGFSMAIREWDKRHPDWRERLNDSKHFQAEAQKYYARKEQTNG